MTVRFEKYQIKYLLVGYVLNSGIHAREWIVNAVATYMIRELVENYEQNKDLVDNLNFHILPLANPDGYEYSRSSVSF